jgi:hypothetical protein
MHRAHKKSRAVTGKHKISEQTKKIEGKLTNKE